jgi:hypothetical protein
MRTWIEVMAWASMMAGGVLIATALYAIFRTEIRAALYAGHHAVLRLAGL